MVECYLLESQHGQIDMLMQESDWKNIKHFTRSEKWGDWTKLDSIIVYTLDKMRDACGLPIIIHCAYEVNGHTTNSQHYLGKAVDLHIKGMTLIEQFIFACKFGWNGIGVYPDWNNQGLHLDVRESDIKVMWGQQTIDGVDKYVPMDKEFIKYVMMRTA